MASRIRPLSGASTQCTDRLNCPPKIGSPKKETIKCASIDKIAGPRSSLIALFEHLDEKAHFVYFSPAFFISRIFRFYITGRGGDSVCRRQSQKENKHISI